MIKNITYIIYNFIPSIYSTVQYYYKLSAEEDSIKQCGAVASRTRVAMASTPSPVAMPSYPDLGHGSQLANNTTVEGVAT